MKWSGHIHRDRRKSWTSPDVQDAPRLLFESDSGTGDVYIFRLPEMTLKGTLTGFEFPQGECADKQGNVYITDTNAATIYEYSRTGSQVNAIADTYGHPDGCAVNPLNGDLAVADYDSLGGGPGHVLVYSSPSGQPAVLTNQDQENYLFPGYDQSGDLWVDGATSTGSFILSSCSSSSCSTVSLSGGTIYFPGAVIWDSVRKNWVIFDQYCNDTEGTCSYPVSGSGVLGSPTTYSNYEGGKACDIIQADIAANGKRYMAGGDYDYCGFARNSVARWAYPSGGAVTHYSTLNVVVPSGAAISTK